MADNKAGRDDQADDADRRQRERAMAEAVERADEPEPPIDPTELADLEADLEEVAFPATGRNLVAAVGDREVRSDREAYRVAELLPDAEEETFEAPAAVVERVMRPTVAAEMKRIVEASESIQDADLRGSQGDAYEKTLVALRGIDADDDDEVVEAVADWIVGRIREKGQLPGSRTVRKRAAKIARERGYEVRDDEWLGA